MNRYVIGITTGVFLLIGSTMAVAEGTDGPRPRRGSMSPPAEAIEACKDMNEGAAVEIITPRGDKLKATCKHVDGQLVAVPEGGFRGPKGNPPDDGRSGQ